MTRRRWTIPTLLVFTAASWSGAQVTEWLDEEEDAAFRFTDLGANGFISTGGAGAPDLIRVGISAWLPTDPILDPYTGIVPVSPPLDIFRLDVVFRGLVNPPAEIGLSGLPFDPFRYGPSPVLGFLEIDVDDDIGTGGEIGGAAELRYLANVGRFGSLPTGPLAGRAARSAADYDLNFATPPDIERSGQDFSLVLCGCHEVTVVAQEGDDATFSEGETWIVRSRFFQRAGGYSPATTTWGGSDWGTYDPHVDLRFTHDLQSDTTTITLVFPLTQQGAAMLTGEPIQPTDSFIGSGSHASVQEGIEDLIVGASSSFNAPPGVFEMINGWAGRAAQDYLDPSQWSVHAIVGTSYATPEDALYVWTDVAFRQVFGDFNGDGLKDTHDAALIRAAIAMMDGTQDDADLTVDGSVLIPGFGVNFSVYDVNSDGLIDDADIEMVSPTCVADVDDDDDVDVVDLLIFLGSWFSGDADFNANGATDVFDLLAFLNDWFARCAM